MKQNLEKKLLSVIKDVVVAKEKKSSEYFYRSPGIFHLPKRPMK